MRVGVIGAGHMGEAVARLLARAGHSVVVANSRGPESLRSLVAALDGDVRAGTAAEAAQAEVVFLATPYGRNAGVLAEAPPAAGAVLVDVSNFYAGRDGSGADPAPKASSVVTAELAPGARVVKALNTVHWRRLADEDRPDGPERLGVPVAGDDADAKELVAGLLRDMGLDPVDAGDLAASLQQEPGGPAYNQPWTADQLRAAL
ncbi:MAG TPA: NAD(P)-binding domain-containing protein [Solirubrobacteraceae bacterium]|nr:NAD(P)-binding domain-containing protein [Solirubrobacteraceae bacterium]